MWVHRIFWYVRSQFTTKTLMRARIPVLLQGFVYGRDALQATMYVSDDVTTRIAG
jgi:hypothetical protein